MHWRPKMDWDKVLDKLNIVSQGTANWITINHEYARKQSKDYNHNKSNMSNNKRI